MIVKTVDLNGKEKYFNAFSGKEVRLQREFPRYQNRMPDHAYNCLEHPISVEKRTLQLGSNNPDINAEQHTSEKYTFSWIDRLIQWFKSLSSNGKRK